MIENFLNTSVTVYDENTRNMCGDVQHGLGITLMAKVECHPVFSYSIEGVQATNVYTIYCKHECTGHVVVQIGSNTAYHSSVSYTNYYKNGAYEYTRIDVT